MKKAWVKVTLLIVLLILVAVFGWEAYEHKA